MRDTTVEYDDNRRSKKWALLLLAFLLGAVIGWLVSGGDGKNVNDITGKNRSNSSEQERSDNNSTVGLREAFADYSEMLVEAGREGVDTPSDEATAAKQTLASRTDALAVALNKSGLFKNTDELKNHLNKVNEGFLAYASTARSGDQHEDLDKALAELGTQIKDDAKKIENQGALLSGLVSFKNAVLESIRNFVNNNYQGSYDKQLEAESHSAKIIELLE